MTSEKRARMMAFCGDLFFFQHEQPGSKGSEISFWKMSFNRESRNFLSKDDRRSPMYKNVSREVDIIHCSSAVDVEKRQKVPCVLLKLRKKGAQAFKYMLYSLNSSTSAKLQVKLTLPYEMDESVSILRGPTLVWSHGDTVFYTSSQAGGVREVPVRLDIIFIGELPLSLRNLAIFGSRPFGSGSQKGLEKLKGDDGHKTLLYLIEDGRIFSGTCLLPDVYSAVVRCMVVLSAEEVEGSLRSTVLAATCKKQLVRFENGLPEDVCILPYDQPKSIQIVHTGASDCLVVVVFDSGNVCAVWKDMFKVAAQWTGVSSLLVDDFVGCGSEQMLLLFDGQHPVGADFGNYLLTNLNSVHYSSAGENCDGINLSEPAQENVLLTVQALEHRLQSGLAFLQELQRDMSVKDRVLQQTVTALTDLVLGREHVPPSPQQEGLVPLWDEEDKVEELDQDERMQTESGEQLPKVQRLWHRVIGQTLVFGALLTPATDTVEESVTGSVLHQPLGSESAPAVVQSRSRTLWYPEPLPHQGPPAAKRSRLTDALATQDASRLALLTVTDLTPLMTSVTVICSVLLRSTSAEAEPARQCGCVNLDIKEVLQGKFHPRLLQDCGVDSEESREDLLGLLAVLEPWFFRIESSDHTVVDVAGWLEERMGAERVQVSPQYLLMRTSKPSDAMLFHWQLRSPFQGVLGVHCSGQFGMLHFLDSFCNFLPASHRIALLKSSAPQQDGRSLALSLEREMKTVREGFASLLQGGEEEEVQVVMGDEKWDPGCPEQLQSHREEWQRKRERSSRRLRTLVDPKRYRCLLDSLIQTQLDGDIAALVEAGENR